MEKTLVIIKPDGVGKRAVGEIIRRFETEGFKLIGLKMLKPERKTLEEFYSVHKGKPFFEPFMSFVTSGPIIAAALEADSAVERVRGIIGSTDSKKAAPGTLRSLYGTDNRRNLVHASDSRENAKREIEFFFKNHELLSYDPDNWINK
jgi:nucleoside-diphosphate kinase